MSANKLIIYNVTSILKSRTILSMTYYLNNPMFIPEYVMYDYLPTRYARLCKYVLRGYDVKISNPYWELKDIRMHMMQITQNLGLTVKHTKLSTIASYWHMFWSDRIDKDGRIILHRPPTWNRGEIPSKIKQNT